MPIMPGVEVEGMTAAMDRSVSLNPLCTPLVPKSLHNSVEQPAERSHNELRFYPSSASTAVV